MEPELVFVLDLIGSVKSIMLMPVPVVLNRRVVDVEIIVVAAKFVIPVAIEKVAIWVQERAVWVDVKAVSIKLSAIANIFLLNRVVD